MKKIRSLLKAILGMQLYQKLAIARLTVLDFKALVINTYNDGKLFYKHSTVFKQNTFNKIESRIVLCYHGLEKGFLHQNFKYRFGEAGVKELVKLLKLEFVIKNNKKSQIASAYLSICKYYERHEKNNIDISDYFGRSDYMHFKGLSTLKTDITKNHNRNSYFANAASNFDVFSNSRDSVRSFTGEMVSLETINKVIDLAKNAPSVCNRQPTKVYYVGNKEKIDNVLSIQGGLTGYSSEITQVLIIVSDRNYFYSVGERNQLYIDGGIFVMNLLYALHFYKIGACPAHWGHNCEKDTQIQKEIALSDSEKVICIVPIGIPKDEFKTTLSLRRSNDEILKIVEHSNIRKLP